MKGMTVEYSSDYYSYGSDAASGAVGAFMGFMLVYCLVILAIAIVLLIAEWKVFKKAGKPGWAALIPFYNLYTLFDIVYPGNGIKFLFLLIPFYNIYVYIKLYIDLAKAYGYGGVFAVGLIFLSPIFMCIMGFGGCTYQYGQRRTPVASRQRDVQSDEEALANLRARRNKM